MSTPNNAGSNRQLLITTGLLALVVLLIAATGYRTYQNYSTPTREFDWSTRGMSDFHNGVYYPAMAFGDGVNPYSAEAMKADKYTITRESPLYHPWVFIFHIPFAQFSIHTADVIFFVFNLALLAALAWCSVWMSGKRVTAAWVLGIFGLLLVSRPGHVTIFTGYFTLEMVLGTVFALHFARTIPALSGFGMLFAAMKPTYILPLIFLMLCRRNFKAVAWGILFCTIAGLAGLGWLASHSSFGEVIDGIKNGQQAHHLDETEYPINTWTRTDLVGMVAKVVDLQSGDRENPIVPSDTVNLVSMLLLLIIPGIAVYRISETESNSGATGLSAYIIVVAMLVAAYHHSYDCLLVVVPWVAVTFFGAKMLKELGTVTRWTVALLTAIPAGNYLSTQSARDFLGLDQLSASWQAITLINGVCLLLVQAILVVAAFRVSAAPRRH